MNNISVLDLIDILEWNRALKIETVSGKLLWQGIAKNTPEELYKYSVYKVSNSGDTFVVSASIMRS